MRPEVGWRQAAFLCWAQLRAKMSDAAENPYSPPRLCPDDYRIAVSLPLRNMGVGLFVVMTAQSLSGAATAVVISREGISARGFVFGMALFTVVLSMLVSYAGAVRLNSVFSRIVWGSFVSVFAWAIWLLSLSAWEQQLRSWFDNGDIYRVVIMVAVTAIFVVLFLVRTNPADSPPSDSVG